MDSSYWLRRVVTKVNKRFLDGSILGMWSPDEDDPKAEAKALDTLELARIITSEAMLLGSGDMFLIDEIRNGEVSGGSPHRTIVDFNLEKFQRFCEMYGLNPTSNGILAQLKILGEVQPVVSIGQATYAYNALSSDSTVQAIVAYGYKHCDKNISLDELRVNISRQQLRQPKVNIAQLFKASVFNQKDGLLRSFAEIGTKSFMLKETALLTPSEVAEIKKLGTRKD